MAAEKTCGACNGVMLGSTSHACGECKKDVHSWALCERVMMPVFGHYFCSTACLQARNAKADADAADEDKRPFPVRRRPESPELPAEKTPSRGGAGPSGVRSGKEHAKPSRERSPSPTPRDTEDDRTPRARRTQSPPPQEQEQKKSPRKSPEGAAQKDAAAAKLEQQLKELINTPWLGKTKSLDAIGKEIISHYEQRAVLERKLEGGVTMKVPVIKYRTKYEPPEKERQMNAAGFNPTRLGHYLIKSTDTPDEVKESVARKMRSGEAKAYVAKLDAAKRPVDGSDELKQQVAKAAKADGGAQAKADERQNLLDQFIGRDAPMPPQLFSVCFHLLGVFFLMCRLSFATLGSVYFLRFLWSVRPNFVKQLPSQARQMLAGSLLDEIYEETQEIAKAALDDVPGRPTLGMDGHKDGKRRHVETITTAKLGISVFTAAEHMKTSQSTGKNLAAVALKYLTVMFIAIVADNTSNNIAMFAILLKHFATLFCLGCFVHVLDLLIEDIAKLPKLKKVGEDAHFVISFVKRHGLLYEEFLEAQSKLQIKCELVLYPATRFAYLCFMLQSAYKNRQPMRLVAESPVFDLVLSSLKKRGKEGEKAVAEFRRFRELVEARSFYERLAGGKALLEPFSIGLHYGEGDGVPLSHVLPIFQLLYDFAQQLEDFDAITTLLDEETERDAVTNLVMERWLGEGQKTGLKHDVHLLAFVVDPSVQAALTRPTTPECDLLSGDVLEAARRAVRHMSSDDSAKRAVLLQQLMLWNAATPSLSPDRSEGNSTVGPMAVATGNNAYSSLRLAAMELTWAKIDGASRQQPVTATPDHELSSEAMREQIRKFRMCSSPVSFWLSMMQEAPRGAGAEAIEAHKLFCKTMSDVSGIIGHTCGVERAGKAYGLVMSSLRKSMHPTRAQKCTFVFANYGLSNHAHEAGDGYHAFEAALSGQQGDGADDDDIVPRASIRRGRLILDDANSSGAESEASDGEDGGGDDGNGGGTSGGGGGGGNSGPTEVKWALPEGFALGKEPSQLDDSMVGETIYLRWKTYGWQVGRIVAVITSATPRLFKKFNFRIVWADGQKGPASLCTKNYASGPDAALDSWVILKKATTVGE